MNPLVSVVISAYNLAWCIEDTIRSVLNQTYKNVEIIVVDDASTDDTGEKVAWFGDRVIYIRHATNQGTVRKAEGAPARNTGIQHSRGELIAFLDGDDLWKPEKLMVQVEAARRYPESGLIAVDGVQFNSNDGAMMNRTLFNSIGAAYESLPQGAMLSTKLYVPMLDHCLIETPSQVMIPRKVLGTVGLFDERTAGDYEMYIRVAARYDVTVVKQSLVRYRYHPSSESGPIERQRLRFLESNIAIWTKHLQLADEEIKPVIRKRIAEELYDAADCAFNYGRKGHRAWASSFLLEQFQKRPSRHSAFLLLLLWCPGRLTDRLRQLAN